MACSDFWGIHELVIRVLNELPGCDLMNMTQVSRTLQELASPILYSSIRISIFDPSDCNTTVSRKRAKARFNRVTQYVVWYDNLVQNVTVDGWKNFDGDPPYESYDTDYDREKCICKLQAQFRAIARVLDDVTSIRQFHWQPKEGLPQGVLAFLHRRRHQLQKISIPGGMNRWSEVSHNWTQQLCELYQSVHSISVSAIGGLEQLNIILHEDNKYNDLRLSFNPYAKSQAALQSPASMPTIDNISSLSSLSISSYPRLGELISDVGASDLSNLEKLELFDCQNLAPFLKHVGSRLKELAVFTKEVAAVSSFLASTEAELVVLSLVWDYSQDAVEFIQPELLSCVRRFKKTLQWVYLDGFNNGNPLAWRWDTLRTIDLLPSQLRGLGLRLGTKHSEFQLPGLAYPCMESLQYLRIQSTESLSVNQLENALHSLMSDFLTNTKESEVLPKTPKLRYIALEDQNFHVLYRPGFNCQAFERIKLVKSSASVPSNLENPFGHFLHPELQFKFCG